MERAHARRGGGARALRAARSARVEPPDPPAASCHAVALRAQPRHPAPRPQARERDDRRLRRGLRARLGHRREPATTAAQGLCRSWPTPGDRGTPATWRRRCSAAIRRALGAHRRLPARRHALRAAHRAPPHVGQTRGRIVASILTSPPALPAGVPDELAALVRACMNRDVERRPESADVIRRAVADFLRHRSPPQSPRKPRSAMPPSIARSRSNASTTRESSGSQARSPSGTAWHSRRGPAT